MVRWQPPKPRRPIQVFYCGRGCWDDHDLDIPHEIETHDFKVTGTGHHRIEQMFLDCCQDRTHLGRTNPQHIEQIIAAWICKHACSFVLFDTKHRATVIGFEREDDAEAFRRHFIDRG